jgi:hypothetical protein
VGTSGIQYFICDSTSSFFKIGGLNMHFDRSCSKINVENISGEMKKKT